MCRIDGDARLGGQLFGDVTVGDGTEEAACLANTRFEGNGVPLEAVDVDPGIGIELLLATRFLLGEGVGVLEVGGGGGPGKTTRQEEVAGEPVLDFLHIADERCALDVLKKDDLHRFPRERKGGPSTIAEGQRILPIVAAQPVIVA